MKFKDIFIDLAQRAARRAAALTGGALILEGNDLVTTLGVLVVLGEYGLDTWRERRKKKRAERALDTAEAVGAMSSRSR